MCFFPTMFITSVQNPYELYFWNNATQFLRFIKHVVNCGDCIWSTDEHYQLQDAVCEIDSQQTADVCQCRGRSPKAQQHDSLMFFFFALFDCKERDRKNRAREVWRVTRVPWLLRRPHGWAPKLWFVHMCFDWLITMELLGTDKRDGSGFGCANITWKWKQFFMGLDKP